MDEVVCNAWKMTVNIFFNKNIRKGEIKFENIPKWVKKHQTAKVSDLKIYKILRTQLIHPSNRIENVLILKTLILPFMRRTFQGLKKIRYF